MPSCRTAILATLLFLHPLAPAIAEDAMPGMDHTKMGHPAPKAAAGSSSAAFAAAMAKMHKDMDIPQTGNADADFVRGMIPHHQGAVEMAKIELEFGKDPQIRALAEAVIKAQEAEIAIMKAWLSARGQ